MSSKLLSKVVLRIDIIDLRVDDISGRDHYRPSLSSRLTIALT